ncbi:MAG: McrC family protein [Thermomicrobiales bacterium]
MNPGSTVGICRLPSGTQIEFRPKIPLRSLLWLLARAYGINPLMLHEFVVLDRVEHVFEIVVSYFADMVERLIDLGLYRNYVEEQENLTMLRGRILVREDMQQNLVQRHRTFCEYTSFSWDLPENQVILYVVHLLSGWAFTRKLTARLLRLESELEGILFRPFDSDDINQFVYNRASDDYRSIHNLCRLFLDGASLAERSGAIPFDGFLVDMNVVFERAVGRSLSARLLKPYVLSEQHVTTLDDTSRVTIRPDLVVSLSGTPVVVADCKYKRLAVNEHKQQDLYQLLAYCTAMNTRRGILIYPRHLAPIAGGMPVRNSQIELHEYAVCLNVPITELDQEFDRLAQYVLALNERATAIPGGF